MPRPHARTCTRAGLTCNGCDCLPPPVQPRAGMATAMLNKCMYVFGGYTGDAEDAEWRVLGDTWVFSFKTKRWTLVHVRGPTRPAKRRHAVMCADETGNCLWLHGGSDGRTDSASLWCLRLHSPTAGVWEEVHCASVGPAVSQHCAFVDNQTLYVVGGQAKGEPTGQAWAMDLIAREWRQIAQPPHSTAAAAGCVDAKHRTFVMVGGAGLPGAKVNALPSDPEALLLQKRVPHLDVPAAGHTMVTCAALAAEVLRSLTHAPAWNKYGTVVHQLGTALATTPSLIKNLRNNASSALSDDADTPDADAGTVPTPTSVRDKARLAVAALQVYVPATRPVVRGSRARSPLLPRVHRAVYSRNPCCVSRLGHAWSRASATAWWTMLRRS